jgi:hypothetical protein
MFEVPTHWTAAQAVAIFEFLDDPNASEAQFHQIAGSQLAVQTQFKQGQSAGLVCQLGADSDGPHFLELERCLLDDNFFLVP